MKHYCFMLFSFMNTNLIFTSENPIIKIGAQIINKSGLIITKEPKEIELAKDDTYDRFRYKLLVAFKQTQLDSVITPSNLFLGDILKSSGLISKHHKDKLKPIKEEIAAPRRHFSDYIFPTLDGQLYPSANFSMPIS